MEHARELKAPGASEGVLLLDAALCLQRNDGRIVTFDSRNGSTSITREQTSVALVAIGRKGDRFMTERETIRFLGRTRCLGIRSGLRTLGANREKPLPSIPAARAAAVVDPRA